MFEKILSVDTLGSPNSPKAWLGKNLHHSSTNMSLFQRDGALLTGHAQSFLAIAIVFPVLATFFVIARFYCRRLKRVTLGVEDWLVLAALVSQSQ